MYKNASRFLKHTNISPSAIGVGPKTRHGPFLGGYVAKLEDYLRAAGCDSPVITRFREFVHSGQPPGFAAGRAVKALRPDLYQQIRSQSGRQPSWTFKRLLKEFARRKTLHSP